MYKEYGVDYRKQISPRKENKLDYLYCPIESMCINLLEKLLQCQVSCMDIVMELSLSCSNKATVSKDFQKAKNLKEN